MHTYNELLRREVNLTALSNNALRSIRAQKRGMLHGSILCGLMIALFVFLAVQIDSLSLLWGAVAFLTMGMTGFSYDLVRLREIREWGETPPSLDGNVGRKRVLREVFISAITLLAVWQFGPGLEALIGFEGIMASFAVVFLVGVLYQSKQLRSPRK